jgi:hypothetical protein
MKYISNKDIYSKKNPESKVVKKGDVVIVEGENIYNASSHIDYQYLDTDEIYNILASLKPIEEVNQCQISTDPTLDFKAIVDKMYDTYKKKNHDYGNSFDQSLDKFGIIASLVRLGDKMNRIESLCSKQQQVKDESIKDTLLDLANYAVMTLMWLNKQ